MTSMRSIRYISQSTRRFVSVGDSIPSTPVFKDSPGNKVDLSKKLATGKSVLVGVPGAFSPACSASHVPGYIKLADEFKNKGYGSIKVIAVNDPFVTKAWADQLGTSEKVEVLSDLNGAFTGALDLLFDATKVFGSERAKRFALLVEDGKVTKVFEEPDNTSIDVSDASKVLNEA